MPADPPSQPEPDDPPLTEAEAALLRRAATMPLVKLDALVKHVDQVNLLLLLLFWVLNRIGTAIA